MKIKTSVVHIEDVSLAGKIAGGNAGKGLLGGNDAFENNCRREADKATCVGDMDGYTDFVGVDEQIETHSCIDGSGSSLPRCSMEACGRGPRAASSSIGEGGETSSGEPELGYSWIYGFEGKDFSLTTSDGAAAAPDCESSVSCSLEPAMGAECSRCREEVCALDDKANGLGPALVRERMRFCEGGRSLAGLETGYPARGGENGGKNGPWGWKPVWWGLKDGPCEGA